MSKPKLVFVEGSIGSGKSSITKLLREQLPHTTLLDLSSIQDKSKEAGKDKMMKYHSKMLQMFEDTIECEMSYVCSRSFLSELCYTELGFKEYSFKKNADELMMSVDYLTKFYDVYFILLLVNEEQLKDRLKRDKFQYVEHSVQNALIQQSMYQMIFKRYADGDNNIRFFEIENNRLDATINTIKVITEGFIGE